jgi:hypothetical protein
MTYKPTKEDFKGIKKCAEALPPMFNKKGFLVNHKRQMTDAVKNGGPEAAVAYVKKIQSFILGQIEKNETKLKEIHEANKPEEAKILKLA